MEIRKGKYIIPNIFTLTSLFLGIFSIICNFEDDAFKKSAFAILFAILCDSIDGRVARMTKTQTKFGIHLDSICDFISFGVAPSVLLYKWGFMGLSFVGIDIGILLIFLFSACGAMRLARFNIIAERDSGSGKYYLGLPIPMAGGTLATIVLSAAETGYEIFSNLFLLSLLLPFLSLLMISNIKYKSFKKIQWKNNTITGVIIIVVLLIFLGIKTNYSISLFFIFFTYVLLGFFSYFRTVLSHLLFKSKEAKDVSKN